MAEKTVRRGGGWIAFENGDETSWPGGPGTISANVPFEAYSKAPEMATFINNADISVTAEDGGIKNFLLPAGTRVQIVCAADATIYLAQAS